MEEKEMVVIPELGCADKESVVEKKKINVKSIIAIALIAILLISNVVTIIFPPFAKNGGDEPNNLFADNGLLRAKSGDKWGYIDNTGKFVIAPTYDSEYGFERSTTWVKIEDKYGTIDEKGQYIIVPQYDDFYYSEYGPVAAKSGEKWGYIDDAGKFIIAPTYDKASAFVEEGLACVKIGDKYGLIDTSGKFVVNTQYDEIGSFSNGLAPVRSGNKWGYINVKGEVVIPFNYVLAGAMYDDGYAIVATDAKKYAIIDSKGNMIAPASFDGISNEYDGFCKKDGCYTTIYSFDSDGYCSEHEEKSYSYCLKTGCYNKVYGSGYYCYLHD